MQSFQAPFFTIGEFEGLSTDDVERQVHLDIPEDCQAIAATLQSAREWLIQQHGDIDMECAAELSIRGYFSFKSDQGTQGFNVENAQLVALEDGFVIRASLDNGICVESDVITL